MRKRRSAKQVVRDFNYVFSCTTHTPRATTPNKPWLKMTDEDIDKNYFYIGKADRTRMKKESARERQRIIVQEALQDTGQ